MTINNEFDAKNLRQAMSMFQMMSVGATKGSKNPFFKNSYADLNEVIQACNQGAQFGLSFSQSVGYKNMHHKTLNTRTDKDGNVETIESVDTTRDIFVTTTIYHAIDEETLECVVPVLIKGNEKDDPQKMGSSITYAKRYGLQALYGIGSDDDANKASGVGEPKNEVVQQEPTAPNTQITPPKTTANPSPQQAPQVNTDVTRSSY